MYFFTEKTVGTIYFDLAAEVEELFTISDICSHQMPLKTKQNRDILISNVFQKKKRFSPCQGGHVAYMSGFGLTTEGYMSPQKGFTTLGGNR